MTKKGGWVYIISTRPNGILYIGVTADIARRIAQHKAGEGSAFTKRYGLNLLVYAERYEDIRDAIAREKILKHWQSAWKVRLIVKDNPDWNDLAV